jgi:hypothetical protein
MIFILYYVDMYVYIVMHFRNMGQDLDSSIESNC